VEIEPNRIWRRHTDQLKDNDVPVTDHSPVSHPVPSATIIENRSSQVAEPSEQSKAISREAVYQSAKSGAKYSVSDSSRQVEHFPVKQYPTRMQKPPARLDL